MIFRVAINLLDNASKYTQFSGAIRLNATSIGSIVEVAFADNGRGIPEEQLKSIFEEFTRVRQENNPEGTGLGLAFWRLAIKTHGGRIWAESVWGQGTTLRFTFPIYIPPA